VNHYGFSGVLFGCVFLKYRSSEIFCIPICILFVLVQPAGPLITEHVISKAARSAAGIKHKLPSLKRSLII